MPYGEEAGTGKDAGKIYIGDNKQDITSEWPNTEESSPQDSTQQFFYV